MRSRPLRLIDVDRSLETTSLVIVEDSAHLSYATLSHTSHSQSERPFAELRTQIEGYVRDRYRAGDPRNYQSLLLAFSQDNVEDNYCLQRFLTLLGVLQAAGIRHLWADLLCINQTDLHELRDEIMRMGDIYRASKLNIIVTPEAFPGTLLAGSEVPRWFQRGWTLQEYLLAPHNMFLVAYGGNNESCGADGAGKSRWRCRVECAGLEEGIIIFKHGANPCKPHSTQKCVRNSGSGVEILTCRGCCYHDDVCPAGQECTEHYCYDWHVSTPLWPNESHRFKFHVAYNTIPTIADLRLETCPCMTDPCDRYVLVQATHLKRMLHYERVAGAIGPASRKPYAHFESAPFEVLFDAMEEAHCSLHGGQAIGFVRINQLYGDRQVSMPLDRIFALLGVAGLHTVPGHLRDIEDGENGLEMLWAWVLSNMSGADTTALMALDFAAGSGDRFTALPNYQGGEYSLPTIRHQGEVQFEFIDSIVVDDGIRGEFEVCRYSGLRCTWEPQGAIRVSIDGPRKSGQVLPYGGEDLSPPGTTWKLSEIPSGRMGGVINSSSKYIEQHEIEQVLDVVLVKLTLSKKGRLDILLVCQETQCGRFAKIGLLYANAVGLPWEREQICIGGRVS